MSPLFLNVCLNKVLESNVEILKTAYLDYCWLISRNDNMFSFSFSL